METHNFQEVPTQDLAPLIEELFFANIVPMLHGSPAIGKSNILAQVANNLNLQVIDLRLGQMDMTDLNGFPTFNKDRTKAGYIPMDTFPLEGDPLPPGKDGWCIVFDEINTAPPSMQASAYKIILDRMVGQQKLHENVVMACAGNRSTDQAIVHRIPTPLQSRMAHFIVEPTLDGWLIWADKNNIDHRITSFLQFRPEYLYKFDPNHNGNTYPSPRTWEFTNRLILPYPNKIPEDKIPLIASVIDNAGAIDFYEFSQIHEELSSIPEIIANPKRVPVPSSRGTQFALSGAIAVQMDETNATPLMEFMSRLDIEFTILCIQQAGRRRPSLARNQTIKDWMRVNGRDLF